MSKASKTHISFSLEIRELSSMTLLLGMCIKVRNRDVHEMILFTTAEKKGHKMLNNGVNIKQFNENNQ